MGEANLLVTHVRLDVKFSRTLSNFGRKMRPFGRSLEPCILKKLSQSRALYNGYLGKIQNMLFFRYIAEP